MPVKDDEVHRWFGTYFCGCGDPEQAMQAFREVLGWYQLRDAGGFRSWVASLHALKEFEAKHGTGLTLFLQYLLGGTGLTEHGGSVYGAWLTPLGLAVKEFLEANPDWLP